VDERTGRPYLYYNYPPGGNGGFLESDGPSAMNPVDLGDIATVQSVERLETEIPHPRRVQRAARRLVR
jgi:N-methylhydantoinase B